MLRDGKVWPVSRELPATDPEAAAAAELLDGPSAEEVSELDATTAIPADTRIEDVQIADGVASVTVSADLSTEALAQVVYTLTQFPTIDSVEIDGKTYTRADFEDQTPAILVESPLPFEAVTSPIRAAGTANTFEATFNYEIVDADGKVVDENFVTATSGTGHVGHSSSRRATSTRSASSSCSSRRPRTDRARSWSRFRSRPRRRANVLSETWPTLPGAARSAAR